jgi:hypothetical protein
MSAWLRSRLKILQDQAQSNGYAYRLWIGVVIVLAMINAIAWQVGSPRLHDLNEFSAGLVVGCLLDLYFGLDGYR